MEQINYQPAQASVSFNPVQQADITSSLKEQQAKDLQAMNRELQQMQRNAQTKLQNIKSDAFPVQELAQFSNTLTRFVQDRHEDYKKNVEAEMTMLAFTDQMGVDPEFDEQEKQLEETGRAFNKEAGDYELQTGDVEGAERIRNLTGWEKYYYMKAKTQQAGKGFGAFMTTNATNEEFTVNGHTLASAPDAATRQAVAARMASNYMTPYQGLNKSFLGKYLFPSMQQGMASTIAGYAAENAKKLKANRLDEAGVLFRDDPSAAGAQQYRETLTSLGYSNKEIRGFMLGNASTVAEVEAIGAIEFGGNGKTFAENYDKEYNEALNGAVTRQDDDVQRALTIKQQEDAAAKLAYMEAEQQDIKDGSFDADPARLQELADQAKLAGHMDTATHIESRISETVAAKSSTAIRKGYELQMSAGVIPSQEEIMLNPALTQEDKQALVKKASEGSSKAEPTSEIAKNHKEVIKAEIEARAGWDKTKASNPSVIEMNFRAWQEYKQVYNNEFERTSNPALAAERAMGDFRSKFGDDRFGKGPYGLIDDPNSKDVMTYNGYSQKGTPQASTAESAFGQIENKLAGKTPEERTNILQNQPELFEGESKVLTELVRTAKETAKVGSIPPSYYQLQQKTAGRIPLIDIVQQRLIANGLDPLPDNVTSVVSEVQGSFDEDSYKYISYKPNATRTDIGLISSGQQPVYLDMQPVQRQALDAIARTESGAAGYDAVNQGGADGGTKVLGYSGAFSGMSQHGGRKLTDLTIGEVMELQRDDGRSWDDWFSAGKLHAAGRYQIVGSTLKGLVQRHNVPLDVKFSPELQDFLALSLLNSGGDGQWVGPTGEDRAIIRRAVGTSLPASPWRQPANMRPELLQ